MQTPIQKQKYKKDETHKGSDVKINYPNIIKNKPSNPKNQKIRKKQVLNQKYMNIIL